jgi:hypothetical protein
VEDGKVMARLAALAADGNGDDSKLQVPQDTPENQIRNLLQALEHRTVLGQATGILMERYEVSAEVAFRVLLRLSQEQNVKIHAIAQTLADTGDFPGLRRPSSAG